LVNSRFKPFGHACCNSRVVATSAIPGEVESVEGLTWAL
jgi:hypothetical protein